MRKLLLSVILSFILLMGCSTNPKEIEASEELVETSACIEWVDVIMFNDITYRGNRHINIEKFGNIQLGDVYNTVAFKMSEVVTDIHYETKNGDSAYHEIGTLVYEVVGYSPEFRLAIDSDYGVTIYEVAENPNAIIGEDFLDIDGKVAYITLNSEEDGLTPLGKVEDIAKVETIVAEILSSPIDVDTERNYEGRYFIEFHLKDGSSVIRNLLPKSNMILDGIIIEKYLVDMLLKCLEGVNELSGDEVVLTEEHLMEDITEDSSEPDASIETESNLRELDFTVSNFLKLDQENRLLKEEIKTLNDDITGLYGIINEERDITILDRRDDIKNLEDQLQSEREEFEYNNHMVRVSVCNIEDTFRSLIFHLRHSNYENVEKLISDNIGINDGLSIRSHDELPFILPDGDFYYTIDSYSIDVELGKGNMIYEFFDNDNERIYFCVASFVRNEYTWYLNNIISTMEP